MTDKTIEPDNSSTTAATDRSLQNDGNVLEGEIHHPLSDKDGKAVAAMRNEVLPFKGQMNGPAARAPFDEVMEQTPDAAGVTYEDGNVGGVTGIWCRPENALPGAVILYLHGGAYVLGSAYAYRHFAGQIASRANTATFVADYRLAPEHPFPAAIDDAKAAYQGLVESEARSVAIVGDSAGGGLALSLLSIMQIAARKEQGAAPTAAAVMSPWTDLALTGQSFADRAEADPLVTKEMLAETGNSYLDGSDPRDPLASPLYAALAGLPPIQLHVGADEVLLDDARRYAKRARAEKVDAVVHIWDGMTHVFPSSVGKLTAAEQALEIMAHFLTGKLRNHAAE